MIWKLLPVSDLALLVVGLAVLQILGVDVIGMAWSLLEQLVSEVVGSISIW